MEVLQAKNLKKIYGSGNNAVHALDGVDLSVKKGEFVAIVGTSGSGKSTLLHMLGGLDRPTSGTVMVDGQDIFSLKEEALTIFRRRKIGFVFQAYNLVPVLNVYENIVLPIELDGGKVNKDFVQQIVQTLGLDDRLDALPNQLFNNSEDLVINEKYIEIRNFLKEKKDGDMDSRDILTIKGLIRRGEARTACTYNNIPLERCHFLDLPFYETGKIQKNPISEADVEIVRNLLREIKPHQIFVAGDLADPHGTHRVCTDAVFAAVDLEKEEGAKWLKDCRIWMYRGAWAEWEIENIEMAVPISPEELRAKRNSILKHQSQMESAPFLGNDERLFWQRSEDRNRGTATLYDQLGLASYEAMEAFVEYIPL